MLRKKNKLLRENERLRIEFDLGKGVQMAKSRVEEAGPRQLKVSAPMERGVPVWLPRGMRVQGKLLRDDALYCFDSIVIDQESETIPLLVLSVPDELTRVQRRKFYRVPAELPVDLILPMTGTDVPGALYDKQQTVDVSAGGVRVQGEEPLPVDSVVFLRVHLPGRVKPIQARARIARIEEEALGRAKRQYVSIRFEEIDPEEQDAIVQYVFNKSNELRRST